MHPAEGVFRAEKDEGKAALLKGLSKILLDIDRAIAIIRNTEEDAEVIPNLMIGFGIDEVQANFIAETAAQHQQGIHSQKAGRDLLA